MKNEKKIAKNLCGEQLPLNALAVPECGKGDNRLEKIVFIELPFSAENPVKMFVLIFEENIKPWKEVEAIIEKNRPATVSDYAEFLHLKSL